MRTHGAWAALAALLALAEPAGATCWNEFGQPVACGRSKDFYWKARRKAWQGIYQRRNQEWPAQQARNQAKARQADGDLQLGPVREVRLRLLPWLVDLGEEHLLVGPALRPPVPQPALQRPQLPLLIAPWRQRLAEVLE